MSTIACRDMKWRVRLHSWYHGDKNKKGKVSMCAVSKKEYYTSLIIQSVT